MMGSRRRSVDTGLGESGAAASRNDAVDLRGKVAVVTGAGRGIGRAHAFALAAAGAKVTVNDIDADVATAVASEIRNRGGAALADSSDIASETGSESLIRATERSLGHVDILVNNAGAVSQRAGTYPDRSTLRAMVDLHLWGTVGAVAAVLPGMLDRGWGRIINTVSEVAMSPRAGAGDLAYGAAKGAVWSASLMLAADTVGSGVTVNAISPGARTRLSADTIDRAAPSRDLDLDPAHVAQAMCLLLSDEFEDVTGAVVHVAGGHVREYLPSRRSRETELVSRLAERLNGG